MMKSEEKRKKTMILNLKFFTIIAFTSLVQAQDPSGFISIDCGLQNNATYTDSKTSLNYVSDATFIETGIRKSIASEYSTYDINQQLQNLRSFPEGVRNCYNVKLKKGNKYLIRASFMYGNYDGLNKSPIFDLQLGYSKWDTVEMINATKIITKEIIHVTATNYLYVCLVNTDSGTPFISSLEFRPLNIAAYNSSRSLVLFSRLDVGSTRNQFIRWEILNANLKSTKCLCIMSVASMDFRFPDDVYDRIWTPRHVLQWAEMNTLQTIDLQSTNNYQPPSVVMSSISTPANSSESMSLYIPLNDPTKEFFVFMHFAEIEKLKPNQTREFNIYYNEQSFYGPLVPNYLYTTTVYNSKVLRGGKYQFSIKRTERSTLPPILNAIEIYSVLQVPESYTNQEDVDSIMKIKSLYGIKRNWQGDPCNPKEFSWDGLNCSYNDEEMPRITSLNLSSSGLTGEIPSFIFNLKLLESLDLSDNNLNGSVPDFLSQLPNLKILNLTRNKLSGPIPSSLVERSNQNLLELSVDESNLCASSSCHNKKKRKNVVPVVASLAGVFITISILAILFYSLKRKPKVSKAGEEKGKVENQYESLDSKAKGRHFTYSEIQTITNNFSRVLGNGGFGTVYHGYLDDTQVAIKMLSASSVQGYKQFQAEVQLLLRVHHRNLTSLVGFCNEGNKIGLIYEYMANGDLENLLSGNNRNTLRWDTRLQIAVEAAKGLEYLHNGSQPPIVHRDVKTSNILLNDKFQAKLADFGLSRSFPLEGGTHVSTVVAGTPGYLDPEYSETNWLTEKSDVYSFGVVLLRIITGRPVIATMDGRKFHIRQWVYSLLANGDIENLVDPNLNGDFNKNSAWKAVEIAMACTSLTSGGRPTMHQVVSELNECVDQS